MINGHAWQRRHAIHIVSELPDDYNDAILVLRFALNIVEQFFSPTNSASRHRTFIKAGQPALGFSEPIPQRDG